MTEIISPHSINLDFLEKIFRHKLEIEVDPELETNVVKSCEIVQQEILPNVRYFAYLEISRWANQSKLHSYYQKISESTPHFAAQKVMNENEIWPVFQKLFNKKSKNV